MTNSIVKGGLVGAILLVVAGACTTEKARGTSDAGLGDPGNCVVVDMAVSPEKSDLILALAKSFNGTKQAKLGNDCIFVRPQKKSSGAAAQLLYTNWNENVDGPRPVVWSPAASSWGQIVNQRRVDSGQQPVPYRLEAERRHRAIIGR